MTKATKKSTTNVVKRKAAPERSKRYQKAFDEQAAFLAAMGCTDAELADFFKVSVRTIHRWKEAHHSFRQALEVAKDVADERVEKALYSRAIGYWKTVTKVVTDEKGKTQFAEYQEFVPGDVTAQIFWLKNRQPHNWRERKEITGADGGPIQVNHGPREAISQKLEAMRKRLAPPDERQVVDVVAEPVAKNAEE